MEPIKYHRTYHVPWSEGSTSDDKMLSSLLHFENKEVIVTEKMDGENTSIYKNYTHARSCTQSNHETRNCIKQLQSKISMHLSDDIKLLGENVAGVHSIEYTDLESYFYLFGVQDNTGFIRSWDETVLYSEILEIPTVPVIYIGEFDYDMVLNLHKTLDLSKSEGYVIRLYDGYHTDNSPTSIAKYVRANHVQTDNHWMHSAVKFNKLRSS